MEMSSGPSLVGQMAKVPLLSSSKPSSISIEAENMRPFEFHGALNASCSTRRTSYTKLTRHANAWSRLWSCNVFIILFLLSFCHYASATSTLDRRKSDHVAMPIPQDFLIYDRSPPPVNEALWRRDPEAEENDNGGIATGTTGNSAPTGLIVAGGQATATSLPVAFDSNMGQNFTNPNCPVFLRSVLKNPSFIKCHPVSMMLQTSTSFFEATKSMFSITNALDASCSVPLAQCEALLSNYAVEILHPHNCLNDFDRRNPVVVQAYNGLISYAPVYAVTCLKTVVHSTSSASFKDAAPHRLSPHQHSNSRPAPVAPQHQHGSDGADLLTPRALPAAPSFCYADAVTNASAPTDGFIYYLPLGVALPASWMPSCNPCLQRTMAQYATYAANGSQPLSRTYAPAAQLVDMYCGPTFANTHVRVLVESGAPRMGMARWAVGAAVAAASVWMAL